MVGLLVARSRQQARELSNEVDGRVVDLKDIQSKLDYIQNVLNKEIERLATEFPDDALEYNGSIGNTKTSLLGSWSEHRWFVEFDFDLGESEYLLKEFDRSGGTLKLNAISHLSSIRPFSHTSEGLSSSEITENRRMGLTVTERRQYPYTVRGDIVEVIPTPARTFTGVAVNFSFILDDGRGNMVETFNFQNQKFYKNILILKP